MATHEIERTFPKPSGAEEIITDLQGGVEENSASLSALEDRVNVNENDVSNLKTYVETVDNGVYVGDRNDPKHRVRITKDAIDFLNDNTPTAYVSGSQMVIPTANVTYLKLGGDDLNTGTFVLEYMSDGSLVLKER